MKIRGALLGLTGHGDTAGKSVERVWAELREQLHTAERNIRFFLAMIRWAAHAKPATQLSVKF